VPREVQIEAEAAWSAALGRQVRVASGAPVGGGCISPSQRVLSQAGDVAFLKWGDGGTPAGLFTAEATSLEALSQTGALRIPRVLGQGDAGAGWLLLEWLEPGRPNQESWRALGRGLATLHRTCAQRWGWAQDNFIGSLPQANGWLAEWPEFWGERRLLPQLERAYRAGHFPQAERRRFEALLRRLPELLAPAREDGPSLVHGDLWSGNVHITGDGAPAIIDPASYYGHREVDLAMSELFGGFDAEFYRTYGETWPLTPGYDPVRRAVYQLYYLLVHVNLFGGGYVGSTLRALAQTGA
ncbi:MAG TPA: fructosamine kinase family protein, partial [Longimicrobiales bacterium]